jgi:hypothetical protein
MVESWLEEASRFGFGPEDVEKAWNEHFLRWSKK